MRYINGDELATLIKSDKTPGKDYLVVDVRDEDRSGGHIKGSVNEPSTKFLTNVNDLIKKTDDVPLVIFHCALSQIRGPQAARVYSETRSNLGKPETDVAILRDGFVGFQDRFKDDPQLVEKWEKEVWDPEVIALPETESSS